MRALRSRRDRGSVLVLVLVVTVVFGLAVAAVADYATSTLRYSRVTEARADRLAAADAALRIAVDQIRLGTAACLYGYGDLPLPATDLTVDGIAPTVTCRNHSGPVKDIERWALVVTGEGVPDAESLVVTDDDDLNDKAINGPAWLTSISRASDGSGGGIAAADVIVEGGPVVYAENSAGIACDPADPTAPGEIPDDDIRFEPDLVYRPICVNTSWKAQPSLASPTVEVAGLMDADPLGDTSDPNCTVFSPGRYTAMPITSGSAYFKSGPYYFEPVGTIDDGDLTISDATVTVGKPPGPTSIPNAACESAWAADGPGGAVFYFGGNAHLVLTGNAQVELFPRTVDGTEVSIQAICGTEAPWCANGAPGNGLAATNLTAWPEPPTSSNRSILRTSGASNEFVSHGLVYAPTNHVRFEGDATDVQALGGLVAGRLVAGRGSANTSFTASAPGGAGDSMTLILTATAQSEGTSRMSAVVEHWPDDPPPTQTKVRTWRVCESSGC